MTPHPAVVLTREQLERRVACFEAAARESDAAAGWWAAHPQEPGADACAATRRRDAAQLRAEAAAWTSAWRTVREPAPPPAPAVARKLAKPERRVAAYLARLPSGLREGGGRRRIASQLGAVLTRDFALSVADALAWAHAWNQRNAEPLAAEALEAAVRGGAAHEQRPAGAERAEHVA